MTAIQLQSNRGQTVQCSSDHSCRCLVNYT